MFELSFTNILIVLQLAILEGLLSFDNALALAALVKKYFKNPIDQKRALLWGIWGAYAMRTMIIFIGVWLMRFEWIKVLAGFYLVYFALRELVFNRSKSKEANDTGELLGLND
ncbi:MAG: hypothetical protein K2X39_09690, partial [Silvanigrellaceae bacterium]|nr:hypothetical protein [Silvanigrellaceae bacterium]